MARLIGFLLAVTVIAAAFAWLANRPGELLIQWQDYHIETSVFRAIVLLITLAAAALFIWSLLRQVWRSPSAVGNLLTKRRHKRGLDSLSSGMIALGAGDRATATRAAIQARKSLPNEPLTHLLRAQAAQLSGDRPTARRIFEAMLASPDTEQLGLRGLFLEAEREGETDAARHFAQRALDLNPKLDWAADALFQLQCRQSDWTGALETLAIARKHGHIERPSAERRRAVLLTAQAQYAEEHNQESALNLALEAHSLAPGLVPAAAIAGRFLASRGNTPRAAKILQKTWSRSPHPDLATAYAYARIGDSPRDRLDRVKQLAALSPNSIEGPIAVASAAIEARQYDEARAALEPLLQSRLTQRVATLMARIEGAQHGDKGRVREWLARAVIAPRDPAWTADGIVADRWGPISPVTGALDAFQWRVPVEPMIESEGEVLASKLEELVALGAPREVVTPAETAPEKTAQVEVKPQTADVTVAETIEDPIPLKADKGSVPPTPARNVRDSTKSTKAVQTPATRPEPTAAPPIVEAPTGSQAQARQEQRKISAKEKAEPAARASAAEPIPRDRASQKGPVADRETPKTIRPVEPRIFEAPRPPDDPGPDTGDQDDIGPPLRPQRA